MIFAASMSDSDWSGRKGALQFESRFESGNLQQARRVLVLTSIFKDIYMNIRLCNLFI